MNQQNTQPLYKVLNEKRTQGEWTAINDERDIYSANGDIIMECLGNHNITNEEDIFNAKYTALTVNNLAKIADKLERFISYYENAKCFWSELETEIVKEAKEALKAIS